MQVFARFCCCFAAIMHFYLRISNFCCTFVVLLIPEILSGTSFVKFASHPARVLFFFILKKIPPIIFAYIKEKQYLCTRIMDFERRSNDGQATVKRQSKPTCSQRRPENKPKIYVLYYIIYLYIIYFLNTVIFLFFLAYMQFLLYLCSGFQNTRHDKTECKH